MHRLRGTGRRRTVQRLLSAGELDLIGSENIEMNDLLKHRPRSRGSTRPRAAVALTELTAMHPVPCGEGTLGKLVRDDEVYQCLVSLTQCGETPGR